MSHESLSAHGHISLRMRPRLERDGHRFKVSILPSFVGVLDFSELARTFEHERDAKRYQTGLLNLMIAAYQRGEAHALGQDDEL